VVPQEGSYLGTLDVLLTSSEGQPLTDAVEKVRGIPLERNNRIITVHFLNRTCAFHPHFESMLLRDLPKIFFRQHRPQAVMPMCESRDRRLCA